MGKGVGTPPRKPRGRKILRWAGPGATKLKKKKIRMLSTFPIKIGYEKYLCKKL